MRPTFAQSGQSSKLTTIPSPTGGLNALSNLAAMPESDAITLTNFIPQSYGCTIRGGSQEWATGLPGPVDSLMVFNDSSGTTVALAVSEGEVYDITLPGVIGAPVITQLNSSVWQDVTMANSAGTHLLAFSGYDNPIVYNKNAPNYHRLVAGDGIVAYTIKGVDPKLLIQATVHQRRLWAVQKDSTFAWFLPADSIYGEMQSFDFGPNFKRGGQLAMLLTWTVDSGSGSNDHLVGVSSKGEVAVYQGTDVGTADAWNLVGVYFAGTPVVGRRFGTRVAGDQFIVTQVGMVSLATMITSTQVNIQADTTHSEKVQYLISSAASEFPDDFGWEVEFIPSFNLVFVNIPSIYNGQSMQLVSNQINGSWCAFTGFDARCWKGTDTRVYFGTPDGRVFRALYGTRDNVDLAGDGGAPIYGFAQQAFSYFGAPAAQKQIGMYRPNFLVTSPARFASKIEYDFAVSKVTPPDGSGVGGRGAIWDASLWGGEVWSGGVATQREWIQGEGVGVAASIRLSVTSQAELTWVSTDYTWKSGGAL